MSYVQREAFVISSQVSARIKRLNTAVHNREILFVLAPSGSGKDRFFDWWWQEGCLSPNTGPKVQVDPNGVILVDLMPPPSTSVPPTCVVFSKLWHGLQELDRAQSASQRVRPTGKVRSWFTEQQSLSLIYDNVLPLTKELEPQAFVLLNSEHLDRRALQYLLELRSPLQRGKPRIAQRALIICVTVDPGEANDSKFGKMVNDVSELRLAWTEPLTIDLMDAAEFQEVLLILIRRNLRTVFAADVDQDQLIQEAAEWTQAEWRPITSQLVPLIDEELGPAKRDESRILTNKVWERVRKRWQKRQW